MGSLIQNSRPGAALSGALIALALAAPAAGLPAQESAAPARTPDVHFVPTAVEVVRAMLGTARVGEGDVVYDLGCGDGRIVITAVKRYKAKSGVCVDIDPVRIKESRRNADTAGVTDKIEFLNADLFETDLSKASVVTLYLLPMLNVRLRPKLYKELRPGTRIVSNAFDMGDWKPDSTMNVKNEGGFTSYAYYWLLPADVAGVWKVTGSGGEHTVKLEQKYQQVSGTVTDARVKGDSVMFTVRQGATPIRFTGTVQGDRMNGTTSGRSRGSWSAVRTAKGARPELAAGDSAQSQ
jgi:precorrin-6B methylase 2